MTEASKIKHLWTHKTQDHPTLPDEELVIDHAEGVWVWTEKGNKLMDGFAGLAVVNVGHGRREIAEAIAEQTVKLAYYPTTRQFSNRPAAELAAKLAELTPGDVDYTMFAVSGSEANERAMQIARQYWLAAGHPDKYKIVSLEGGYHGATGATLSVCGIPDLVKAYGPTADAGLHQGEAALPVPRPRRGHRRGAGGAARGRAPRGHRARGAGDRLGGDHGAGDQLGRLHHAADRLAQGRPQDLRRPRSAADRRRGHHGIRAHGPLVRVRARRRGAGHPVGREGHHVGLRPAVRRDRPPQARRRVRRELRRRKTCTRTPTPRTRWPAPPRSPICRSCRRTT